MQSAVSSKGKRVMFASSLLGLLCAPFLFASARTEILIGDELDALARDLPDKTSLLTLSTDVVSSGQECRIVVAKMLASELRADDLLAHFETRSDAAAQSAPAVAYADRSGFHAVGFGKRRLPEVVTQLLSRWQPLPEGTHRFVVFDTKRVDSEWELRC